MKKFPLKPHQGFLSKGYGEITEESVNVHVSFNIFVPESKEIEAYRSYVNHLFSMQTILSSHFHMLRMRGYTLDGVKWRRDALNAIKTAGAVAENLEVILTFSCDAYLEQTHQEAIMDILNAMDNYLNNLQQSEEYGIMIVPQDMSSVRSERKVKTFNAIQSARKIGVIK